MAIIRVLHLLKSLDIGGIETMALDFCRNSSATGVQTFVYCIGGGALQPEFESSPAMFERKTKIRWPYDLIDPFLASHLRRFIKSHRIDVIHAHFADEGLHALLAAAALPTLVVQGFAVDFRINRKIDNLKFRFIAKLADGCVTLSQTLQQQLSTYSIRPGKSVGCVHNGVDPARVTGGDPARLRKELGIPAKAVVGGMVGNFYNAVRDQATVCRALARVMQHHRMHFVFAGGSNNQWIESNESYFNDCKVFCKEAGIADRVHFPGLRKDLPDIFAGLDFYVHATNFDTFGMAPVEAMFNKVPVIVNDHPVFKETSRNGEGMILYKSKDDRDLADKIAEIANDADTRRSYGLDQYEFANTYFHIKTHIENMKEFYQQCLDQKK